MCYFLLGYYLKKTGALYFIIKIRTLELLPNFGREFFKSSICQASMPVQGNEGLEKDENGVTSMA